VDKNHDDKMTVQELREHYLSHSTVKVQRMVEEEKKAGRTVTAGDIDAYKAEHGGAIATTLLEECDKEAGNNDGVISHEEWSARFAALSNEQGVKRKLLAFFIGDEEADFNE
jgi:hypothetical protein